MSVDNIKCPTCSVSSVFTVYLDRGGLVIHEGSLHLLQTFCEDPDVHIPFDEAGINLSEEAECSECGAEHPVRDFLQSR